jgi:archaellum component FlaG (FlaF/FlaG flagellin family)
MHITFERVFGGDRLCRSIRDDFAIVNAPSQFIET